MIEAEKDGSTGSLSAEVYRQLKRNILTCQLKPGQMIFERSLIEQFGVSKTPVREALKSLIQDGLVQSVPGTCYLITPVTVRDVQELFDMRAILEEAAALRAAESMTPRKLERLERFQGEIFNIEEHEDLVRWYDHNLAFHMEIARSAENQRLYNAMQKVLEETHRLLLLDTSLYKDTRELVASHQTIIAAFQEQDGRLAAELTLKDIRSTKPLIQGLLYAGSAHQS